MTTKGCKSEVKNVITFFTSVSNSLVISVQAPPIPAAALKNSPPYSGYSVKHLGNFIHLTFLWFVLIFLVY